MYEKIFLLQEEVFKVLASQKRLEIVRLLGDRELSVGQMVTMLGLPQANLSQHLALLRQARAVSSRRDGQTIYYRLADRRIQQACDLISDMLRDGTALTEAEKERLLSDELLYPIVRDVVCGMRVSVPRAGALSEYDGVRYYFCATGCKDAFDVDPITYIKQEVALHGN